MAGAGRLHQAGRRPGSRLRIEKVGGVSTRPSWSMTFANSPRPTFMSFVVDHMPVFSSKISADFNELTPSAAVHLHSGTNTDKGERSRQRFAPRLKRVRPGFVNPVALRAAILGYYSVCRRLSSGEPGETLQALASTQRKTQLKVSLSIYLLFPRRECERITMEHPRATPGANCGWYASEIARVARRAVELLQITKESL